MLLQIGCSSITQIPLPLESVRSESDIRALNYFGERLSSTILLTDSIEVEAYWLKMRDDKIYFLTEGLDDTTSVGIDKVKTVRFYDGYGGCIKGGWLGIGLTLLAGLYITELGPSSENHESSYTVLALVLPAMLLSMTYGTFFLGEREFNFVQNKPIQE
jgi:hypothetical protein